MFTTITTTYAVLAIVADALVLLTLIGFLLSRATPAGRERWTRVRDALTPLALPLAWLVAALATLGSLYLSEIAGLIPCQLCWFQRIAMYPLILLLGIAAIRGDLYIAKRYFVWLPIVGAGISIYHYQLERFPSQPTLSCGLGEPSCAQAVLNDFGFVSIPFMALAAFLLIATLLLVARDAGDDEATDAGEA
jgi:disulfide bond formation protein DsbB